MPGNCVLVAREESGEPTGFPLEEDGTVSLSTLRSHFERLIGLKYRIRDENFTQAVRATESGFHPPQDGWVQRIYWCIFSEEDRNNKRKCDATTSVSSVAKAKKTNRQEITPETLTDVIDQIDRSEAATPTMSNNQHEREAQYTLTSSPTMTYVTALSRIGFNWERIFFKLGLALFTVIFAVVLNAVNKDLEKHTTTFNTFVTMFACVGSCLCGLDIVYLNRGRIKEPVANRWRKFRGVNGEQSATHE